MEKYLQNLKEMAKNILLNLLIQFIEILLGCCLVIAHDRIPLHQIHTGIWMHSMSHYSIFPKKKQPTPRKYAVSAVCKRRANHFGQQSVNSHRKTHYNKIENAYLLLACLALWHLGHCSCNRFAEVTVIVFDRMRVNAQGDRWTGMAGSLGGIGNADTRL